MTMQIKLTKDDMFFSDSKISLYIGNDREDILKYKAQIVIKKILEDQEKAEKLDKIKQLLKSQNMEGDTLSRHYLIMGELEKILGDK